MTLPVREALLVDEVMRLVDALAGGPGGPEAPPAFTTAEWAEWYALVEVHGLAPGLSRRLDASRWAGLPGEWRERCRRQYLAQTARSLGALRQFQEIREVLEAARIPVIPLKGLSFSHGLYADAALRQFGDLDVLVPEADGARAVALLKARGYTPLPAFTSAEEELLHARQAHFCPLVRPGALPVEVHTQVLKDRGHADLARDEAWSAAARDAQGVFQLDRTHATVLAAAHYATHLRLGAGHLKWLVDLLLLLRGKPSPAAAALRETAARWNVLDQVAPVLAAAGTFTGGPALELPSAAPVPARSLVYSPREAGGRVRASAESRLARLEELPNTAARARYLLCLLFPNPEHLRYRYGIPAGSSVFPYRLSHPLRLAGRLLTGRRGTRRSA